MVINSGSMVNQLYVKCFHVRLFLRNWSQIAKLPKYGFSFSKQSDKANNIFHVFGFVPCVYPEIFFMGCVSQISFFGWKLPKLLLMFWAWIHYMNNSFLNFFKLKISRISEKPVGFPEKFNIDFLSQIFSWLLHMCSDSQKNCGTKLNVFFFTVALYVEVTSRMGFLKRAKKKDILLFLAFEGYLGNYWTITG